MQFCFSNLEIENCMYCRMCRELLTNPFHRPSLETFYERIFQAYRTLRLRAYYNVCNVPPKLKYFDKHKFISEQRLTFICVQFYFNTQKSAKSQIMSKSKEMCTLPNI
jgi:hypothetical protein